ncbi:uncharacterized protein PHALS_04920 [Plasmopara halstedii]|uniref:Uncharacterized protein n=1 Tax=Plasmopara halstedii TaxID=4781 RepID=A0A0P1AAB6_PLAHL|nr:uncharacterized protein PHALS_04920 [Plasmopara halstedii]CEG37319.1 hypothetical protein PHALS_04920 [Plasmopara halstedii]|eukprot:XP_024573688.1 hypothetical protein PHALS_04920 [Plasmopara halstedii]
MIRDGGDNYVPLMEDDDYSQAQPLPTQRNNVDDIEVDILSATEPEEMEVEVSMTSADIRSLMPIAKGSEDRSHAPIDTQARTIRIVMLSSGCPWNPSSFQR